MSNTTFRYSNKAAAQKVPALMDKVQNEKFGVCRVECIQATWLSLRNVETGHYHEAKESVELVLLERFKRKYYYMFVGNHFGEFDKKNIRFIVESDHVWTAENRAAGRVIARNTKAPRKLGETLGGLANPSKDIEQGICVSFVPCPRKHILAMEDHGLSQEEKKEIEMFC